MSKKEIEKQIYYIELFLGNLKKALASDSQMSVRSEDVLVCAMKLDKAVMRHERSKNV
jgi:hypothetical protein